MHRPTVLLLLNKGADVKAVDKDGVGALWLACARGDSQIVEELLLRGADPNEKHLRLTETALMWASKLNRPASVQALLKAGADVNQRSAIRVPAQSGQQEVGLTSALLWAAPRNDPETVKLLLNANAGANAVDMRGFTPLMLAVTSEDQNPETVQMLLKITTDINHHDENGLTALDWARKWGSTPIVRLLENAGVQGARLSDPPPESAHAHFEIREAVEKSAALLQSSSPKFFEKTGCVGCHHHMLTGMLVGIARERGFRVDEKAATEQIRITVARRLSDREPTLVGRNKGGYPMLDSLFLVGLAAQKYPADALTDADVHSLMAAQREDGSWQGVDRRPPLQYSPVSDTAYAIRAIQQYALPGRRKELAQRIERATIALPCFDKQRLRHRPGAIRVARSRRPFCVQRSLPARRQVSAGYAIRRRVLACDQPRGQVPTLFRKWISARSRPMDFKRRNRLGSDGTGTDLPATVREFTWGLLAHQR